MIAEKHRAQAAQEEEAELQRRELAEKRAQASKPRFVLTRLRPLRCLPCWAARWHAGAQSIKKLERDRSASKLFPEGISVHSHALERCDECVGKLRRCMQAEDVFERVRDSLSLQVRA